MRELQAHDVSIHEIARQMEISRQTVRRFLRVNQFPEHSLRCPRRRKRDSFLPYLREQLAEGNDNGVALWRMLRDRHEYSGSRSQVTQWVAHHRHLCPSSTTTMHLRRGRPPTTQPPAAPISRRRSARQVSWLLIRPVDELEAEEQQLVERLTHTCTDIQLAYTLGQAFIAMVKSHDHAALDQWLVDAQQSEVNELQSSQRAWSGMERLCAQHSGCPTQTGRWRGR